MPNSSVILAILNIIFYIPALPVSVYVVFRHGFKKSLGFFFILTLSLIRLVGEPMIIASSGVVDYTNTVSLVGFILSNVGVSPLTLAPLGLLHTANSVVGMHVAPGSAHSVLWSLADALPLLGRSRGGQGDGSSGPIPTRFLALVHLLPVVSVALTVSGITSAKNDSSPPSTDPSNTSPSTTDPSSNPASSYGSSGSSSRAVAAGLYLGSWALLVLFTAILLPYRSRLRLAGTSVARDGLTQLYATALVLPFLLLRLIDQCLVSWGSAEDKARHLASLPLRIVLVTLVEWIIVSIVLAAGVRSRPAPVMGGAQPLGMPAGSPLGKPVFGEPRVLGSQGSGEGRYEELRRQYPHEQMQGQREEFLPQDVYVEEGRRGERGGRREQRRERREERRMSRSQGRR